MHKILVVVRGYYPEISASGNLVKPLVEELGKGNKVHILSCAKKEETGYFSKNINFTKVKLHTHKPNTVKRIINAVKRKIIPSFHEKKIVSAIEPYILRLERKHNFDLILAITFEEILALINVNLPIEKKAVFLLEKLPIYSNIPFITLLKKNHKRNIEKSIFEGVRRVFALPIMHSYLSKLNYISNEKLVRLEHPMITNQVMKKNQTSETINIIYAGGLDRKQRSPFNIIKLFEVINNSTKLELNFYSYGNTQAKLNEIANDSNVFYAHQTIDPISLAKKTHEADFLITIGNQEKDIVPSKIFDCISTGKPIIHFSQIDDDPYTEYFNNFDNFLLLDIDELLLQKNINRTVNFLKNNKGKLISFNMIKNNFKQCTPSFVAKKLIEQL